MSLTHTVSTALAESPRLPYHVDPILVLTCIAVILGLVVGAFAMFYIVKRIYTSLQNKILDELDDVEAQTLKSIPPIITPRPPPPSRSSTRKSAFADFCRTADSPAVKYEQAVRRSPIRLLYPHPAPRVVPILPTVPPPVHSLSSACAPMSLPNGSQAAEPGTSSCDSRHFDLGGEGNIFSAVADAIVGAYPISTVHPVVKAYDLHDCQLPRSSVLGSIINTLDALPGPVPVPPQRTVLLSSPSTTPTLAVTPPSPEKPSVLRARDLNARPVSPGPRRKNPHGAETGMHRFRKAKRCHGKENRPPIGHSLGFV